MRNIVLTLGFSMSALMLSGCTDTAGEVCGAGLFTMSGATGQFTREVCWHSTQPVGDCDVTNYRIPPQEDFSDYIDIHWDQDPECDTNDLDGSFEQEFTDAAGMVIRTARFNLSGTSPGAPPQAPAGQSSLMGSGTYNTDDNEQGTFQLFW